MFLPSLSILLLACILQRPSALLIQPQNLNPTTAPTSPPPSAESTTQNLTLPPNPFIHTGGGYKIKYTIGTSTHPTFPIPPAHEFITYIHATIDRTLREKNWRITHETVEENTSYEKTIHGTKFAFHAEPTLGVPLNYLMLDVVAFGMGDVLDLYGSAAVCPRYKFEIWEVGGPFVLGVGVFGSLAVSAREVL